MIPKDILTCVADQLPQVRDELQRAAPRHDDRQDIVCLPASGVYVKYNTAGATDVFTAEATGLAAIRRTGTIRVPEVLLVSDSPAVIVMEDVGRDGPVLESTTDAEPRRGPAALGRQLARLHRAGSRECFGGMCANYIGPTPQANPDTESWTEFFVRHRLEPLLNAALSQQAWSRRIIEPRLPNFLRGAVAVLATAPDEPTALVHGDLWSGNVVYSESGAPALIDPAAHYAHREVDIAMTELFGAFPDAFYDAYVAEYPLASDYKVRRALYNTYHALNHAVLFGESYAELLKTHLDAVVRVSG